MVKNVKPKGESKAPKTTSAPQPQAGDPSLAPLFAIHKIDGRPPNVVFRPASAAQRAELLALEAVREPTAAELAAFRQTEAGAAPPPAPSADSGSGATDAGDSASGDASDSASGDAGADSVSGGAADDNPIG